MYHHAARSPRGAQLVRDLQEEALAVLRHRFPEPAAGAVYALIWGWRTYCSFHDTPLDEDLVRLAYRSVISEFASEPTQERRATVPDTRRVVRPTGLVNTDALVSNQPPRHRAKDSKARRKDTP